MAITARSLDQAKWTFCYETAGPGGLRRQLPWAFVQLGDAADGRYVVPVSSVKRGGDGPHSADSLLETAPESMPFAPFPLDSSRPSRGSGPGDANIGGAWALHFFGV